MNRRLLNTLAAAVLLFALGAAGAQSQRAPFAVDGVGGYHGTQYVAHSSGDPYGYAEDVAIDLDQAADLATVKDAITVVPDTPHGFGHREGGRRITIAMRKTPGVAYAITVSPALRSTGGAALAAPYTFTVTTPAVPAIPKPLRAAPDEPYRYGVLAHPFPFSLAGPTAGRQIALMAQAGVRFVRLDYCGSQIEVAKPEPKVDPRALTSIFGLIKTGIAFAKTSSGYDWHVVDGITDALRARGITVLPIVEQYCAPKSATGGKGYPYIWDQPGAYAAFAGAIARHVAAKYPQITRIELFNEPNLHGWWTNANPEYASRAGDATAAYMKAAYRAVKAADPRLTVVGPALADGGHDTDPRTFLENMYAAGCRRGRCWDVLSVHNYRWSNPAYPAHDAEQSRWDIYKSLQKIAAEHGDPGTHVMITEWGYSTNEQPEGFSPAVQARYVAIGFNLMLADPTVDGIVYVNLYNPGNDFWGKTALVNPDFSPKPAFDVYRAFATAR